MSQANRGCNYVGFSLLAALVDIFIFPDCTSERHNYFPPHRRVRSLNVGRWAIQKVLQTFVFDSRLSQMFNVRRDLGYSIFVGVALISMDLHLLCGSVNLTVACKQCGGLLNVYVEVSQQVHIRIYD